MQKPNLSFLQPLLLLCCLAPVHAQNHFLRTLAETDGGITIAYGTSPASLTAANIIRDAIRTLPAQSSWNNMRPAAEFDADTFPVTGQTHVIAVGTLRDNVVLQGRHWLPTWWMDRSWYFGEYDYRLAPERIGIPYQPTEGFMFAGYGEWPATEERIGYIEVDRSPLFMEWMVRTRVDSVIAEGKKGLAVRGVKGPTYPTDFPLRLICRITGSGDAGVIEAARAFAQEGLLGGVVLADGAQAASGPPLFTLPQSRYAASLPFTPPDDIEGYRCIGWLLSDAFLYDGFLDAAGVAPDIMYRVKYLPDFGITNFWTSPHRRATQFEVAVCRFSSAADASTAKTNLLGTLGESPNFQSGRISGFNVETVGTVLFMESLPELPNEAGAKVVDAFVNEVGEY